MSRAPKNNITWQPSASVETLKQRAAIMQSIRRFFHERGVIEVETPLLCHTSVTDPYIQSISATLGQQRYYLQTSPEYAMKRLLAAGSGAIFQLCKAFRLDEVGVRHNPEFTMLEWYRPDFDHHQLMTEMDELLQCVLKTHAAERVSYADLFLRFLAINPHQVTSHELQMLAKRHQLDIQANIDDVDTWLMLLMSHIIEPQIGQERPIFIYDFPVSQSALARIQSTIPPVASRFEVYFKGMELANGFHELQDAKEQRRRFEANLQSRREQNLEMLPLDEHFLAALEHGLPDCAGVALGVDRLVMLALEKEKIAEVVSFDFHRA